jgi:hypothetical protein
MSNIRVNKETDFNFYYNLPPFEKIACPKSLDIIYLIKIIAFCTALIHLKMKSPLTTKTVSDNAVYNADLS